MSAEQPKLTKEEQEKAKGLIRSAFDLFADHFKKLSESLTEFNKKRAENQKEIDRGARRSSGRVV